MHKLMIAEDEALERKVLRKILERNLGERCTVLEAKNGSEALQLYERECPQVLLLDVEMPGFSGLEVARQIRAADTGCSFIFISAHSNFYYAQEAITLRAREYLLKPYAEADLLRAVEDALLEHTAEPEASVPPAEEPDSDRIRFIRGNIERYIQENYHTDLNLQTAAQAMNYSDTHFCRLFKRCFQVNFSVYLTQYRITRAQELLRETMASVKEISARCGYTDTSYFIRVFKRLTGVTPSEYRVSAFEEKNKKIP